MVLTKIIECREISLIVFSNLGMKSNIKLVKDSEKWSDTEKIRLSTS